MKIISRALMLVALLLTGLASSFAQPYATQVGTVSPGITNGNWGTLGQWLFASGYYNAGDGGGGYFQQTSSGRPACGVQVPGVAYAASINYISFPTSALNGSVIAPGAGVSGNPGYTSIPVPDTVTAVTTSGSTTTIWLLHPVGTTAETNDTLNIGAGTSINGGTVVGDVNGNCLTRTTSTGSVREWGAQCDTTNPGAPGTISAGQSTFTIPNNNAPRVGQAIAIAGAGSSGATLFAQVGGMITPNTVPSLAASTTSGLNTVTLSIPNTTIFVGMGITDVTTPSTNSIPAGAIITHITSSTVFTMSLPALATKTPSLTFKGTTFSLYQYGSPTTLLTASTSVPTWIGSNVPSNGGIVTAGSGYSIGQNLLSTSGTGTQITVQTITGGGGVASFFVSGQGTPTAPVPASETFNTGTFVGTITYTATGQYAFGDDDSYAINAALGNAATNTDIWLPANATCGTLQSISLPTSNNSLRGWDPNSSGIFNLGINNGISPQVLDRKQGNGGGARDLFVDAFKGTTYTCNIESGRNAFYENVWCKNAAPSVSGSITSEWAYGNDPSTTDKGGGNQFTHIRGLTDSSVFGPVSQMPAYDWYNTTHGFDSRIYHGVFSGGVIPVENAGGAVIYYDDVNAFDNMPYAPQYCVELAQGGGFVNSLQCGNASVATVHIASSQNTVNGIYGQWNNNLPASTTAGVLIDSGATYDYVCGVNMNSSISAANVVVQSGTPDPTTVICQNPNATYSTVQTQALQPQGRLTLTSGSPIMTSDVTNGTTVYYAPYTGSYVPIFDGASVKLHQFTSAPNDQVGLTLALDASVPIQASGNVYDLYVYIDTTGTVTLGTGLPWFSTTVRTGGTGHAVPVHYYDGVLTNGNATTVYNGTTSSPCPLNQCTYVGTMYATANGQTTMQFGPNKTSGGACNMLGLYNAYNQVAIVSASLDTSATYTYSTNTWRAQNNKPWTAPGTPPCNAIAFVDGLANINIDAKLDDWAAAGMSAADIGLDFNSASATPTSQAQTLSSSGSTISASLSSAPKQGLNYVQAMEKAPSGSSASFGNGSGFQTITLHIND